MVKLFVYGTLKKGFRNHPVMGKAKFLGVGRVDSFTMHKGPGFPYAVEKEDCNIIGELYELENLDRCDRLEGYPHHYLRKEVDVLLVNETGPQHHTAWIYYAGPSVNLDYYPETLNEWKRVR